MSIFRNNTESMFLRSWALKGFIHFVGDMHQPLHAASRVTQQLKSGDRGGQLFPIKQRTENLHYFWDAMMDKIKNQKRPLEQEGINYVKMWADTISKQYTRKYLEKELEEKNPWEMHKYVYTIATKEVYNGIKENTEPTEEYIRFRFETCKKLVALAGYRLADFLNNNLH